MKTELLLDADDTLYDFAKTEEYAISRLFSILGLEVSKDNLDRYHAANDRCWEEFEKGIITIDELKPARFSRFFESIGLDEDPQKASDDYIQFLSECGALMEGAEDFVDKAGAKYNLHIVTNGIAKTQWGRFERSGLLGKFSNVFISEEIGYAKPDRMFFEYVIDRIGKDRSQMVVIGDREKSDIQGAVNAGLDSILLSLRKKETSKLATYSASSYAEVLEILERM